jgi:hypothetical protein
MPVRKFRTLEEAERALWREPFDPQNLRITASITTTAMRLAGITLPKGILKYRTLADADDAREQWESQAVQNRRR